MTVGALERELTVDEFIEWRAFFALEAKRAKKGR